MGRSSCSPESKRIHRLQVHSFESAHHSRVHLDAQGCWSLDCSVETIE